jgi:hypothetical protein
MHIGHALFMRFFGLSGLQAAWGLRAGPAHFLQPALMIALCSLSFFTFQQALLMWQNDAFVQSGGFDAGACHSRLAFTQFYPSVFFIPELLPCFNTSKPMLAIPFFL